MTLEIKFKGRLSKVKAIISQKQNDIDRNIKYEFLDYIIQKEQE